MPLPPGLAGFVAAQEAARRGEAASMQQVTGILGLQAMMENQRQAAAMHPLQLAQAHQALQQAAIRDAALAGLGGGGSPQGALAQGAQTGDVGPTVTNAQRIPGVEDAQYLAALRAGVDPKLITAYRDIAVPKMEVSGNYAYDPRRTGPGFMPALNFNREGQAALSMPTGAGGMPVISAPQGALDVFSAYKNAAEEAGARYRPTEIKPSVPGEPGRVMSVLDALYPNGRPQQSPVAPAPSSQTPTAWPYRNLIQGAPELQGRTPQELAVMDAVAGGGQEKTVSTAGIPIPNSRFTGTGPPLPTSRVVGTPSGLSPEQEAQQAARAASLKGRGEAGVKYEEGILDAGRNARNNLTQLQILAPNIEKLPTGPLYPTLVNAKSYLQQLGLSVDPNLGPAQATTALLNQFALKLRDPAGGGGMPGNLSDADRKFLLASVPGLDKSTDGNKQLIKIFMALEQRKVSEASIVNKMQADGLPTTEIRDALIQFGNSHSIAQQVK